MCAAAAADAEEPRDEDALGAPFAFRRSCDRRVEARRRARLDLVEAEVRGALLVRRLDRGVALVEDVVEPAAAARAETEGVVIVVEGRDDVVQVRRRDRARDALRRPARGRALALRRPGAGRRRALRDGRLVAVGGAGVARPLGLPA